MYWLHMFPSSVILLALGFDYVAACDTDAFSIIVPGMYSLSAGDLNRTSWPGGSSGRAELCVSC